MRAFLAKISLILVIVFLGSCNAIKKVADNEVLLTEVSLFENGKPNKKEEVNSAIIQRPNNRLRLHLYNLAKEDPDSSYQAWLQRNPKREARLNKLLSKKQTARLGESFFVKGFSNFLKENGEPPVTIEERKTQKSLTLLKNYYRSKGFFNVKATAEMIPSEKKPKRAAMRYEVETGNPYVVDSIQTRISSPVIDSIYQKGRSESFIAAGKQYDAGDFGAERDRLTSLFRNNGIYNFQQGSIEFFIKRDTLSGNYKLPTTLAISNFQEREGDSINEVPYHIHTIDEVNIFTDDSFENQKATYSDSTNFKGINIFSKGALRYRPEALTDAVFIGKGDVYSDLARTRTNRALNSLRTFKFPNITYAYTDSTQTKLAANVLLSPRKRFSLGFDLDVTQSNIQAFGLSLSSSVLARNIFRGAETLEFSLRGTLGSSKDINRTESQFFDLLEGGVDLRLNFPRFFFPFHTDRVIPKYMQPSTTMAIGTNLQQNIGLDKQNFTALLQYRWQPNTKNRSVLELMNIEFVNNRNPDNYFRIYTNAYREINIISKNFYGIPLDPDDIQPGDIPDIPILNQTTGDLLIPEGVEEFLSDASANGNPLNLSASDFNDARAIDEREERLTENNLIFASN